MNKITVFNFVSLDGFFSGPNGGIDWFKSIKPDREFEAYSMKNAGGESIMIFGRKTYDMMKSHWPTAQAIKDDPEMAKKLDFDTKLVFSKKLGEAGEGDNWKNITLFSGIDPARIREFIRNENKGAVILGSGSIVAQFANLGLIDEYTLVVVPVVLGAGRSMFEGVKKTGLKLLEEKPFNNGVVMLRYGACTSDEDDAFNE